MGYVCRRVSLVAASLVLGLSAAPALASTTIGPDLSAGPAGSVTACDSFVVQPGEGGGTPSGCLSMLIGPSRQVPADGVVVSFSTKLASAVSGWLRVVYPRTSNSGSYIAGFGRSDTVAVPGDSAMHTYPTRLPVTAGMSIGFVTLTPTPSVIYRTGTTGIRVFTNLVEDNLGFPEFNTGGVLDAKEVPLSATIEPDADKDGFGDETQDKCVGVAGTDGGCVPQPPSPGGGGGGDTGGGSTPPPGGPSPGQSPTPPTDTVAPVLSSYVLSPTSFVAANSGATVVAAKSVGTTVVYKLSEKATVSFAVTRKSAGVKKGKRCVAGKAGHGHKKCTRTVTVGTFTQSGEAGLNSFKFMGRLKNRSLKKGSYELRATAKDAAGNTSRAASRAFKIVG